MVVYIHQFTYVELSLNIWVEVYLILVHDLFIVLLDSAFKYFIENFYIYVHKVNWFEIISVGSLLLWISGFVYS